MNIMQISKMIPVHMLWVFDNDDKKQVKAQTYQIEYSLRTEVSPNETQKQAFLQQNISFSVINSFLYDQLHQSIIYDMDSKALVERSFASHDNNFMILPDMSDACLAMALHCKLNTICHENSFVESISIKDKVDNIAYSLFADDNEYDQLPTINEWLGELSFWDSPWWRRKDFSTFDNVAASKDEHSEFFNKDVNKNILQRMEEPIAQIEAQVIADIYGKEINEVIEKTTNPEKEKGELLEVDFKKKTFKPKLVPKDK